MVQVPYWDGNPAHPYPSVTALIDFRGNDVGEFVFHCHILNHEDLGMMNIIRVKLPTEANNAGRESRKVARLSPSATEASPHALEIADRVIEPAAADNVTDPARGGHHH
jgi:hypothetical protein